jgi:hypothetical protein
MIKDLFGHCYQRWFIREEEYPEDQQLQLDVEDEDALLNAAQA